jgi:hypothetical protein
MNPEGWYLDPFGVHEERWISNGRPTALVRDDGTESHHNPPATAMPEPLVRPARAPATGGHDLLRVGGAQSVTTVIVKTRVLGAHRRAAG